MHHLLSVPIDTSTGSLLPPEDRPAAIAALVLWTAIIVAYCYWRSHR